MRLSLPVGVCVRVREREERIQRAKQTPDTPTESAYYACGLYVTCAYVRVQVQKQHDDIQRTTADVGRAVPKKRVRCASE